jgi:curved DNA-binding protein
MDTPAHDYYEFLQISPNADAETIHRVYRFLAARLHPDNTKPATKRTFAC